MQGEYQASNFRHVKALLQGSKQVCEMMDEINQTSRETNI
jgi:hypothetical protein